MFLKSNDDSKKITNKQILQHYNLIDSPTIVHGNKNS